MAEAARSVRCRLHESIVLEYAGLLLRWGMPIANLVGIQTSAVLPYPRCVHLTWSGRPTVQSSQPLPSDRLLRKVGARCFRAATGLLFACYVCRGRVFAPVGPRVEPPA
jgi:hypothetical protein